MVYDITAIKTFESLNSWKQDFPIQLKDSESFPFVVLGNKADKEDERRVPTSKAMHWCNENGEIPFYETSAKDALNVEEAFMAITKKALLLVKDEEEFQANLDLKKPKKKGKKCCK